MSIKYKEFEVHFGKLWISESAMYLCSVSMFSWCCYEQETQHAAWPVVLPDTCASSDNQEKEDVCLSQSGKDFWGRVSFWRQKAHLFRHAWIALPVRRPSGKLFFLYSFYFMFIFIFIFYAITLFLISYLINTSFQVSLKDVITRG